jgi:hypothetical protein
MFMRRNASKSGFGCRLVTAAVCAEAVCQSASAATRTGGADEGAAIVFGLIGLSAAASAVSVWLVRRASGTRPRSGVLSQMVRNPDETVLSERRHGFLSKALSD